MAKAKSPEAWPTTGQAAEALSRELELDVTERLLNSILRAWPFGARPPMVGRFRRWGPEHVARARTQLEARRLAKTA